MLVNLILSLYERCVSLKQLLLMCCSKHSSEVHVGKYLMRYKLGTGSVGVVRLGVDDTTGAKYAIKLISKGKCSDMSRIDNEIKVLTACDVID